MEQAITVAVIDSNSGTRQGLIRRLRQIPWITVLGEAGNPDEALRIVCEHRPDVVLMDIRRTDRDGAESLSQMAGAVPTAKIIVLTAYVTEQERCELMQAGAWAILLKEIDSERLVRTIQSVAAQIAAGERMSEK